MNIGGHNSRYLIFDVMLGERFVATLRFPNYLADDFVDGKFVTREETLRKYIDNQLPTLRGKAYRICF